jgi:hypothetical protein
MAMTGVSFLNDALTENKKRPADYASGAFG